jgi:hypothetical protein
MLPPDSPIAVVIAEGLVLEFSFERRKNLLFSNIFPNFEK